MFFVAKEKSLSGGDLYQNHGGFTSTNTLRHTLVSKNIYNKCGVEVKFIKGRLKLGDSQNSAPFSLMVVVFKT
jgi:hypothetical protein